jgi:signal transduction histidine kinase
MEQMHRLAWELRPSVLDNFGLVPALRQYVEEWGKRNHVQADFLTRGISQSTLSASARLPAEVETTLYRVVQESLTNVQRHAQATQVGVVIERRNSHALAIIEDNGRGFEVEEDENGTPRPVANRLGLLGMVERVELVGGSLTIESTLGQGTTVYARVPVDPN